MNIVLASRRKYMRKRTNPEGAPASIEDCIVSLVRDSFPYTGQAITPQVTVTTQDGVPLVVNIDYFVSYSDNVNVGAGVVIVTGTGEYVGSVIKTFQITSAAPPVQGSWENLDFSRAVITGYANFSDMIVSKEEGTSSETPYDYLSKELTYGDFATDSIIGRIRRISGYNDSVLTISGLSGMSITEDAKVLNATISAVQNGGWSNPDHFQSYSFADNGNVLAYSRYYSTYTTASLTVYCKSLTSPFNLYDPISSDGNSNSLNYLKFPSWFTLDVVNTFIVMSADGRHAFAVDGRGNKGTWDRRGIVKIDLETPFRPYDGISVNGSVMFITLSDMCPEIAGTEPTVRDVLFSPDGRHMVVSWNRYIAKFELSEPWDISSTITFCNGRDFYNEETRTGYSNGRKLWINGNGTRALRVANYYDAGTNLGSRIVSLAF